MFEKLFSRKGLSLDRLRSFVQVADAGGIARAAGSDPARQSQLSRQIGELEEFFGARLTARRGRHLALTADGQRLATLVREQFHGLENFSRAAGDEPLSISIGAGDSLLVWLVLPRLPALRKKFPRLIVSVKNLRSADIIRRVEELRLDFGVTRANLVRPPLKHSVLGKTRHQLFVPRQLVAKKKNLSNSVSDLLATLPLATLGGEGEFSRALTVEAEKLKLRPNLQLLTESFPQAAAALRSGHYAAILPNHAAADIDPARVAIHELPFLTKTTRAISLCWHPRLLRTRPALAALRAELEQALRLD